MKTETSVALPKEILVAIDRCAGSYGGRSGFIEAAVRAFLKWPAQGNRDARDLEIINQHADELNAEAEDALSYQVPL